VGHLQPRKAVDRLLAAVKLLHDRGRPVTLVLVGGPVEKEDAGYVERLQRSVEAGSLRPVVRFAGSQPDVRPFLFAADVLCLPSSREGMPNVLLEAMACGVPCVAPASAGANELLSGTACEGARSSEGAGASGITGDGTPGVPPSNRPSDLAEAIARLLDDPAARDEARNRGLDRVRRLHAIEPIVDRYEALIGT